MKKSVKTILIAALLLIAVVSAALITTATDYPFENLFEKGFAGYTSDETEVLTDDYFSSKQIAVKEGENLWFGPCDVAQYFQLVGFDGEGKAVTDKVRGKDLEIVDSFNNNMVIYKYTVPAGVEKIVFSAPADVADVYVVSKAEVTTLNWEAYWDIAGIPTEDYVGQSSYYNIAKDDKLYFGVITEVDALGSVVYNEKAESIGTITKEELTLVESFGGDLGIYCYTVKNADAKYVKVAYDITYEQYYTSLLNPAVSEDAVVEKFLVTYGIQRPLSSTVAALEGKSALFVGDSITYGARDRAIIYQYGGWAGRIGYFCDMNYSDSTVLFLILFSAYGFCSGLLTEFFINCRFLAYFLLTIFALLFTSFCQVLPFWIFRGTSLRLLAPIALLQSAWSLPFAVLFYFVVKHIAGRERDRL